MKKYRIVINRKRALYGYKKKFTMLGLALMVRLPVNQPKQPSAEYFRQLQEIKYNVSYHKQQLYYCHVTFLSPQVGDKDLIDYYQDMIDKYTGELLALELKKETGLI